MFRNKLNKRSANIKDQNLKIIIKTKEDINKLKNIPCSINQKT